MRVRLIWKFHIRLISLSSAIGSPHHFVAQGIKEDMVLSFYYLYFIISFTDCEFAAFTAGFTPSVDGNQEIVAAAFYVKCYFPVIVNYNRTYIQTVRRNRADIKATIIALSEKLAYHLKDGARVHIEGIGYFHISLTCPETPTPHSTRANNVKFKSVTFRADKYLKKQLADVKTERSKYKPHSIPVTDEEIDKGLTEYFLTHSVLTRRDFEQLFTLTRATAGRYITRLAKEKKLCNISIPHNPIYEPMPGFYGKEKLPEPEQETDTATE